MYNAKLRGSNSINNLKAKLYKAEGINICKKKLENVLLKWEINTSLWEVGKSNKMNTETVKSTKTTHKLELIIIYRTFYLLNKADNLLYVPREHWQKSVMKVS